MDPMYMDVPPEQNRFSVTLPEPSTIDIDQFTTHDEIPSYEDSFDDYEEHESSVADMARADRVMDNRDETLYRDNPDYQAAYDEDLVNQRKKRQLSLPFEKFNKSY
jgi:hypothetical protein